MTEKTKRQIELEKKYEKHGKGKYKFILRDITPDGIVLDAHLTDIEQVIRKLKQDLMSMAINDQTKKEIRICIVPNME